MSFYERKREREKGVEWFEKKERKRESVAMIRGREYVCILK